MNAPAERDAPRFLPMLQASRLDLAAECLYPWTSGLPWDDETSDAAAFGSALHEYADGYARYIDSGAASPDAGMLADAHELGERDKRRLEACATDIVILLEDERVDWRRTEMRIAYNPESGSVRLLTEEEKRAPGEIELKIDKLTAGGGLLTVTDYKSGRRPVLRRVEDSRQVQIYALVVMKLAELGVLDAVAFDSVRVELAWCSESGIWIDAAIFDPLDADAIEHEVRELHRRRLEPAVPRWGMWCTEHYCPVIGTCPASKAYAEDVWKIVDAKRPLACSADDIADDDHAREMLCRIDAARAVLDVAEKALQGRATRLGALDLGDGRHWGLREHAGKEDVWNVAIAEPILRERLGELADGVVKTKRTISKDAITAACRKLVASAGDKRRGALKMRVGAVLAALRGAGAVTRGAPYSNFGPFKKRPDGGVSESEEE